MKDKIKIIGLTFSISFFMFIALAIFIKALGILLADWFNRNSFLIMIVSGIIVVVGLISGAISLSAMTSKGKGLFG